ncbi:hypothetical protein DVH05_025376 [Phytophthora capsici]|nr:hypothetical protein DVH05_025376 [Phytophthora capsici]
MCGHHAQYFAWRPFRAAFSRSLRGTTASSYVSVLVYASLGWQFLECMTAWTNDQSTRYIGCRVLEPMTSRRREETPMFRPSATLQRVASICTGAQQRIHRQISALKVTADANSASAS